MKVDIYFILPEIDNNMQLYPEKTGQIEKKMMLFYLE